jgi:hypothetical protein
MERLSTNDFSLIIRVDRIIYRMFTLREIPDGIRTLTAVGPMGKKKSKSAKMNGLMVQT